MKGRVFLFYRERGKIELFNFSDKVSQDRDSQGLSGKASRMVEVQRLGMAARSGT